MSAQVSRFMPGRKVNIVLSAPNLLRLKQFVLPRLWTGRLRLRPGTY